MAITYETALKLKEAGWNQDWSGNGYLDIGGVPTGFFNDWPPSVCAVPSLEEVIHECQLKEGLFCLQKVIVKGRIVWEAKNYGSGVPRQHADDPLNAAIALWLALNKKVS